MQGIAIREFARRDGCSEAAIRKALKKGRLPSFADHSIDPALVGKWRALVGTEAPGNLRTAIGGDGIDLGQVADFIEGLAVGPTGAPYSRLEAERIKENYLARLRELEYDRKSGAVVEVAQVAAAVAGEYAIVRNRLLGIPAKLAPRVAVLTTAEEVRATLETEIIRILEGLTLDGGGQSGGDVASTGAIRERFPAPA